MQAFLQKHPLALATAGFSCLYAVAIVLFYYDWLFGIPAADPLVYGVALNGTLCLAAAVAAYLSLRKRAGARPAIGIGTASYIVALILMGTATTCESAAAAYGAGALGGIGAGTLMPQWFRAIGRMPKPAFAYALGIGSLVSAPAALVLDALPAVPLALACIVLVAGSSWLLSVTRFERTATDDQADAAPCAPAVARRTPVTSQHTPGESQAVPEQPQAPIAPFVYVTVLSIAYGMLDFVAMAAPSATAAESGFASQVGGIAIIVVFLAYIYSGGKRYATLLNVALAVIATGLIFLPFLPDTYSIGLVVLTHAGWELSLLVLYALVIETFREDPPRLVAWSAIAFAAPRPGVVAGWLAATALADNSQFAFAQMTLVAFALLYLILMGMWLLRTREQRTAERAIRKRDEIIERYLQARGDLLALTCDELAREYQLTKREGELLRLLAQGRDTSYIEHELFLSRNTVKSYTKSLYAKLGVHSKQELIDLTQASMPIDTAAL